MKLPLQRKGYADTPDREKLPSLPSTWGPHAVLAWANKWRLKTEEISGTEKCQSLRVSYSLKENSVWMEVTLSAIQNLKGNLKEKYRCTSSKFHNFQSHPPLDGLNRQKNELNVVPKYLQAAQDQIW